MEERINSIKITDDRTGEVFELDFNRESVVFAEERGFLLDDVGKFPVTKFPEFFYYAFRAHHRSVSRHKTDSLYERLGGMSSDFLERLILLYNQARATNNVVETTDEMGKNGGMSVEL